MSAIEPTSLAHEVLVDALREQAAGEYRGEAAAELLIRHGVWTRRRDFLAACVSADDDGWTRDGTATLAAVDWEKAAIWAERALASSSERAVLTLACQLAGSSRPGVRLLGHLVPGLDPRNSAWSWRRSRTSVGGTSAELATRHRPLRRRQHHPGGRCVAVKTLFPIRAGSRRTSPA